MPKAPRNAQKIIEIKDRILEEALQLILDDGFVHFSMRRLGARLGMTAANIYNYFTNKDEIYLLIQTKGFARLAETFEEIGKKRTAPLKRIEEMIRAYLAFGTENPDYYEIMFSRNTPKYADYVGTAMEPAAFHEKQTALRAAEKATAAVMALGVTEEEARFRMIQLWSMLNGLVNLLNSRVLQEVDHRVEDIVNRIVDDLMKPFREFKKEKRR
ncbi:MAG: TetR/AcrR family transcriptional regulator [Thermodesulfobacteriota bacterium]